MSFNDYSLIQALFAIGCALLSERRGGSPIIWFLLGVVFGPIAFALLLTNGKRCNKCQSVIPKEATVCSNCRGEQ